MVENAKRRDTAIETRGIRRKERGKGREKLRQEKGRKMRGEQGPVIRREWKETRVKAIIALVLTPHERDTQDWISITRHSTRRHVCFKETLLPYAVFQCENCLFSPCGASTVISTFKSEVPTEIQRMSVLNLKFCA